MEFVWVLLACLAIGLSLVLVCSAASNSQVKLIEQDSASSSSNKKTFPSMKKGSRFMVNGRVAEKISDTMYQYTDTSERLYWMAHDLHYYQMMSEPSHEYEAIDGGRTESYSTPDNTYVAPIIVTVPSPIGTPIQNYNTPDPTPSYHSDPPSSYSSPGSGDSYHSSSHSSHSSCSSSSDSSSHSSCSSSSSSSCSSSSCGGSSCGGGD